MFETSKTVITNSQRGLFNKIKESPVLYFFFSLIMFFSVLMFSFLAFYLQVIDTPLDIKIEDVFFMVFFIFMIKSAVDMYNHFIQPGNLTYSLSTRVSQSKTVFEIFFSIFLMSIFIWFVFSTLFILFLMVFPINIYYPLEYLFFNIGVISAIFIGSSITINFFSEKRYRLIPTIILLGFFLISQKPTFVVLTMPLALLHLIWSIKNSLSSYQNIRRKTRIKEKTQIKIRSNIKATFFKEITILWRDKLFFSFIFTSAITGFGTGYLYLYGDELLIPVALRHIYSQFLPSLFIFVGVLIVVIYTSVFPSLALFLNEEKTMWIIRHTPIDNKTLIIGKTTTLFLCFITTIPFIAFISIFVGLENLIFVTWLLAISYIISACISIPLGVKYVGKKSDIMLLYSVTMVLFVILSPLAFIGSFILENVYYGEFFLSLLLFISIVILYLLLILSEKLLELRYPKPTY